MNYNHLNQYQKQISWNMMPKAKEIFQLYTELLKHYDWFLFVTQHFIMRICCWKLEKLVGYFSDRDIQFCTDISVYTLMTSCFQVRNKDPEDPHTELTLEWIVVANCCSSCKWKYKSDFFSTSSGKWFLIVSFYNFYCVGDTIVILYYLCLKNVQKFLSGLYYTTIHKKKNVILEFDWIFLRHYNIL